MFDKWFRTKIQDAMSVKLERHEYELYQKLSDTAATLAVFRINNGFIVQDFNTSQRGFTYCANAKEISEHIIASAAKVKLNIPEQLDLFTDASN